MQWTLEVIVVPVADVDRAKAFYADAARLPRSTTTRASATGMRVVQLTPPGSGCSIVIGEGVVPEMEPGSLKGLQLVVARPRGRARASCSSAGSTLARSRSSARARPRSRDPLDNVGFLFFRDPDGNGWGGAADLVASFGLGARLPGPGGAPWHATTA